MVQDTRLIEIKDICKSFGDTEILHNINWQVQKGERCFILGANGAGKTTLIRLLIALINPQEGSIEFYNSRERHTASTLTRGNLVYIPQGNSLISGTIRENLLMGNPEATEEQMREALHIACADYVMELPLGL